MDSARLERKLTLFPVVNIVIANMIGAGIFTTSGLLMSDLHHPLVMLALWLIGGAVALCGALCYGELGATFPRAGGEYAFLSQLYHPLIGFLSGWVSLFVGFSAAIAASAIGFSEYLLRAFPLDPETFTFITPEGFKRAVAVGVIVLFIAVHLRGIQFGSRVQNGLTLVKVLLILALIVLGFSAGQGRWSHLVQQSSFSWSFSQWKTMGLGLMWIMFAYSGWNAAVYIGSEIKRPKKNLPLSLLLGTGSVVVLYLLLNLFYLYAVDPQSMRGVISISGLAAGRAFGPTAEMLISLMIGFALFSSLSAFIILGPRVYYAMARDGVFFDAFSRIHPRFKVPSKAILLQGGIAVLMVLSGSFDQILTYMGFSLGIFPLLSVLGVFKLRRTGRSALRMPGYPMIPALYLFIGTAILLLSYFERPLESSLAVATVLLGIPFYLAFVKKKLQSIT